MNVWKMMKLSWLVIVYKKESIPVIMNVKSDHDSLFSNVDAGLFQLSLSFQCVSDAKEEQVLFKRSKRFYEISNKVMHLLEDTLLKISIVPEAFYEYKKRLDEYNSYISKFVDYISPILILEDGKYSMRFPYLDNNHNKDDSSNVA